METTDDEMRQVQNRRSDVARTGPEMGDGSPSRDASATESNAIPRVVARESPVTNPQGRSAVEPEELNTAVRIRGPIVELAGRMVVRSEC